MNRVFMLNLILSLILPISTLYNDSPEPWQFGFQDGASPTQEGITELHDTIFFYLVVILFGVVWVLSSVVTNFHSNKSQIVYKYANHGTLIELIWTITPAVVLIAIAFPSFKLLYMMDISEYHSPIVLSFLMRPIPIAKLPVSTCKELVAYGQKGSTLGIRLNSYCLQSTVCSMRVLSQLVGHLLGDGSLTMSHTSVLPYFVFTQTFKRFEYTWDIYIELAHFCGTLPKHYSSYRNETLSTSNSVRTRSYPFLMPLYCLFYTVSENGKMVKTIS